MGEKGKKEEDTVTAHHPTSTSNDCEGEVICCFVPRYRTLSPYSSTPHTDKSILFTLG